MGVNFLRGGGNLHRNQFQRGKFLGVIFTMGQLSYGGIIMGGIFIGEQFSRGQFFWGGQLSGGNFPYTASKKS